MGTNPDQMNPFSGTHAIVIEYDDVLRSPMLTVMEANKRNYKLDTLIDLKPLRFMYTYGMFEWYRNRFKRNPLKELDSAGVVDDETAFNVMKTFIASDSRYTTEARPLPFQNALKVVISQKFSMKYFIYNEYSNPYVEKDVRLTFSDVSFEILTGPFVEAISDVPPDATWVLSDIRKLEDLKKADKLNFANIMVAGDYRYNFTYENADTPMVDIDALREKAVFKLKMFMASSLTDDEKEHLNYLLRD